MGLPEWGSRVFGEFVDNFRETGRLDEVIKQALISLGKNLTGKDGNKIPFLVEEKYTFLGKKQSEDIINILALYSVQPKVICPISSYGKFAEDRSKELILLLKGYCNFLKTLLNVKSFFELCNFKKNLKERLKNIEDFVEKSEYKKYTKKSMLAELSKKDSEKGLEETYKDIDFLGDFIERFIELLKSSLKDLDENEEECAIFINSDRKNSTDKYKLNFYKLGLKRNEVTAGKKDSVIVDCEEILKSNINAGCKKSLKSFKSELEKNYKEFLKQRKSLEEIHCRIALEISKLGHNMKQLDEKVAGDMKDDTKKKFVLLLEKKYEKLNKEYSNINIEDYSELEASFSKAVDGEDESLIFNVNNDVKIKLDNIEECIKKCEEIYDNSLDMSKFVDIIENIDTSQKSITNLVVKITKEYKDLLDSKTIDKLVSIGTSAFGFLEVKDIGQSMDCNKIVENFKKTYSFLERIDKILFNFSECFRLLHITGFETYKENFKKYLNDRIYKISVEDIHSEDIADIEIKLKELIKFTELAVEYDGILKKHEEMKGFIDKKTISTSVILERIIENMREQIKKSPSKTERIKNKLTYLKDKIKGKLGMDSKSKYEKGKKESDPGVKKKK